MVCTGAPPLAVFKPKWLQQFYNRVTKVPHQAQPVVAKPAQHLEVASKTISPSQGASPNGQNIFPELAKVWKDYAETTVGVESRHSLLPAGKLLGHLLRVLAVKEKMVGKFDKPSVERDFGEHAAIGVWEIAMIRGTLEHTRAHDAEHGLAVVVHSDQLAEALVRMRRVRGQNLLVTRQRLPVLVDFNRF